MECLTLEITCARLKREIALITAAQNRGGAWNYDEITSTLDKEFEEWQQRVAAESAKLEAARERLSSLMNLQDATRFQKLYRQLAKELHPDIHPERHPRLGPMWDRLQRGYANGDLAELELLEILLKDEAAESPPSSMEILRQEIATLKTQSQSLVEALFTLRQTHPFTLAALLNDLQLIEEKKSPLLAKRDSLADRKIALSDVLNKLLDGHS